MLHGKTQKKQKQKQKVIFEINNLLMSFPIGIVL